MYLKKGIYVDNYPAALRNAVETVRAAAFHVTHASLFLNKYTDNKNHKHKSIFIPINY